MRRRTLRPSSRFTLTLILGLITLIVVVILEVGRLPWYRTLALAASCAVFLGFALGWSHYAN